MHALVVVGFPLNELSSPSDSLALEIELLLTFSMQVCSAVFM